MLQKRRAIKDLYIAFARQKIWVRLFTAPIFQHFPGFHCTALRTR